MDIYAMVTDRIMEQLENGVIPWQKPWMCGSRNAAISRSTGKPYSLLNQMLLGRAGEYVTFKQCQAEGGKVKKGAKAQMVVFWKWIDKVGDDGKAVIGEDGKPEQVPLLRYYSVFHIDQCEGLSPKHETAALPAEPDAQAESMIDSYLLRSGVKLIEKNGDKAFYSPASDWITVPQREQFAEAAEYYSTVFHEMTHSTGHRSRLNRLEKTAFFGSEAYSKEELVAEIGAAALVNVAGLETEKSFRNSAAYVQSWLSVLRNDKRFIVSAAGKAEKAVVFILGE